MNTVIIVVAVFIVLAIFGFLLLVLLRLNAISTGGVDKSDRRESGLSSTGSVPTVSARRGIPIWQLLLAVVLLCFTSEPADDRHD